MTTLRKMTEDEFRAFKKSSAADYAVDLMMLLRLKADNKTKPRGIMMACLISVMILISFPTAMGESEASIARGEKNPDNTWLGTAGLSDPDIPADKDAPWSGSYVYFGTYDGSPIKFRMLAKDATAYTSGKALFLDSDESLFVDHFDHTEPYSGSWDESDIRSILNGPFLDGFTAPEQAAIAVSSGNGGRSWPEDSPEARTYGAPVAVNDRVFLLDVSDVTNAAYGYAPDRGWNIWVIPKHTVPNRVKGGMFNYWWLRSSAADDAACVGDVNCGGLLNLIGAEYYMDVAPALNLDQASILFATQTGAGADEFKLTLIDRDLAVTI